MSKSNGSKHQIGERGVGERHSVIFVEPVVNGVSPTALGFKRLEDTVNDLQQKFQALDQIANNPDMIERVRNSKGEPLSDMWHVISINKRLDASEEGMEKLTTMMQDLIKGDKIDVPEVGKVAEEMANVSQRIAEVENHLAYLSADVSALQITGGVSSGEIGEFKSGNRSPQPETDVKGGASTTTVVTKQEGVDNGSEPPVASVTSVVTDLTTPKNKNNIATKSDQSSPSNSTVVKQSTSLKRRSIIGSTFITY